ncbi:MAG: enoyl-CoA hydratase-related protein [Pseudomonadota bacterium]
MTESTVLTKIEDGIATVTLNAPKTLNALSPQMIRELNETMDAIAADPAVRVFILTGAGRGFCSGADLSAGGGGGGATTPEARGEATRKAMHESLNPIIKKIADLPVPTISAVNGVAAGGGYGVALACDLVIAAESAKFVLVFTPQLGLIPDLGASWHAPRALGRTKAMAAAFFGDRMSAADAAAAGLIWKSVPDDQLWDEVSAAAAKLAAGPTKAFPEVRRAFDLASRQSLHAHLDYEAETQPALIATEDYVEGVKAFLQKRAPEFKGR